MHAAFSSRMSVLCFGWRSKFSARQNHLPRCKPHTFYIITTIKILAFKFLLSKFVSTKKTLNSWHRSKLSIFSPTYFGTLVCRYRTITCQWECEESLRSRKSPRWTSPDNTPVWHTPWSRVQTIHQLLDHWTKGLIIRSYLPRTKYNSTLVGSCAVRLDVSPPYFSSLGNSLSPDMMTAKSLNPGMSAVYVVVCICEGSW